MKIFSVWGRSVAEGNADVARALSAIRRAPHRLNGISETRRSRRRPPAHRRLDRTIAPQSESRRRRGRRWFYNRRGYFKTIPRPPLVRRMRGVMSRGLTPPTLHPPFQPTPPPRPPDLFRLSPEFQRELIEKWERERRNRELTSPAPPPAQRLSLGDAIRWYLDNNLDRLMSDLRVPRSLRGHIRNAARDAIGRGATEALNRALTQMGVGGGAREAIISSVRAAMGQIRVR